MPNITLMMVTYNRLNLTKQTVENIYKTANLDFNFVIIDNGSTDDSIEYLNKLQKINQNVYIEFNKKNGGIAKGRNRALKKALELNSEFLITVDNDINLPNNAIKQSIDIVNQNKNYCIGVNFEDVNYPIFNLHGTDIQLKKEGNLGTAFSCFYKSLPKSIGYFTTEYSLYSHEDANFYFRARLLGYKMGYLKENGVHLGSGQEDVGTYREFKNIQAKQSLQKFYKDCQLYAAGQKSIYIPFKP